MYNIRIMTVKRDSLVVKNNLLKKPGSSLNNRILFNKPSQI